ncbi:MAG TPA: hemerythrin domain-containing protein [Myxococcales bacterium]|nr:hemerythrin domain-containing protein [Myxococcales bacterium]
MISLEAGLGVLRAQHKQLQAQIAELKRAASVGSDVKLALELLRADLVPHLYTEEAVIGPVLQRFAPHRFELLHAEHAHQRAVLQLLTSRVEPEGLAQAAAKLADDLLEDIEAEERDLFATVMAHAGERTALASAIDHR